MVGWDAEPLLSMRAYADTSFIVSLYTVEPNRTPAAIAYMEKHREALPFTPQHRLEVRNAIRLLVWAKRISVSDRQRAFRQIEEDLDAEVFLVHTAIDYIESYRRAEKVGADYNESIGCRSADLFHVAVALDLGFKSFLTFDVKQRQFAEACGLNVEI